MFFTICVGIFLTIIAVGIILIVLIQKPKGEGLTSLAEGSNMKQLVGVAQMPSVLEKLTYLLLVLLFAFTFIFTALLSSHYLPEYGIE